MNEHILKLREITPQDEHESVGYDSDPVVPRKAAAGCVGAITLVVFWLVVGAIVVAGMMGIGRVILSVVGVDG